MEGNDKKTEGAVSYKQLGLIIFVFLLGTISALLLSNAQTETPTTFTTIELIGFVLTVILSGASIVLAVTAIALGRSSEQAVIKRSDESIRLQNEVFTKTTDALQRIESSTGVTEKRIEDMISGRAGAISQRVTEIATRDRKLPPHVAQEMEEDIRRSIIHSVKIEQSEEELEERNRLRQKTEERREIYDKYHKELLYAVAGKQDVQTQKIGHGDVSVEGDSLFDGIFKSKDKRIAISTFPAHSNKAMLTEYLTNATRELAGGAVNKVIIVLFERKDEDEIVKSVEKQLGFLKEEISSKITHVTVPYENISQWVDELDI